MSIEELLREPLSVFEIPPEQIIPHITLDDNAILLLTGTFNQGLATPTSDIDFLLIYPADRRVDGLRRYGNDQKLVHVQPIRGDDASFPMDNVLVINRQTNEGRKIQTYVTSVDYIEEVQDFVWARNDSLRRRVQGDESARRRNGCLIDRTGQVILHRFYTGRLLANASMAHALRSRLPLSEIAINVAIRDSTEIQCYFSDIQGIVVLDKPDLDTLIFMIERVHFHLAVVLLASIQEISPREKLVYRLLKRHRDAIGPQLVDTFFASLRNVVARASDNPRSIEDFVNDIIARGPTIPALVSDEYTAWTSEFTVHSLPYTCGSELTKSTIAHPPHDHIMRASLRQTSRLINRALILLKEQ